MESKNKFMQSEQDSTVGWAAQQILAQLSDKELIDFQISINKLATVLYKDWAKALPFIELKEAVAQAALYVKKRI